MSRIYPSHTTLVLIYKWLHHLKPHYKQTTLSVQERSCCFFPPLLPQSIARLAYSRQTKETNTPAHTEIPKRRNINRHNEETPASQHTFLTQLDRHLHLPLTSCKMHRTLVELKLLVTSSSCSRLQLNSRYLSNFYFYLHSESTFTDNEESTPASMEKSWKRYRHWSEGSA